MLTDLAVRKAAPREKPYKLSDSDYIPCKHSEDMA